MSWIARYLAPFKEPKMQHDPMESGAGAGEPVHPDQDNAPRRDLHDDAGGAIGPVASFSLEEFRAAGRAVYGTDPNAWRAIDQLAGKLHGTDPLTDAERIMWSNIVATFTRSA